MLLKGLNATKVLPNFQGKFIWVPFQLTTALNDETSGAILRELRQKNKQQKEKKKKPWLLVNGGTTEKRIL